MLKNLKTFVPVALASVLLAGCGGGSTSTAPALSLGLTANRALITAGDSVSLSWSPNFPATLSSNFSSSLAAFGTFADTPAISTRYQLSGTTPGGGATNAMVDVAVALIASKVLIVADSGPAAALETLVRLSVSGTVDTSTAIPAQSTAYDLLIVHGSAPIGTADAATVQGWLAAGKRVVVLGTAGNKLASGSATTQDTLSISSWLGAAILFVDGYTFTGSQIYPDSTNVLLSAPLRFGPVLTTPDTTWYSTTDDARLNFAATKLVREGTDEIGAYVFEPPVGGKLFFMGSAIGASGTSWGDIFRCGMVHILR